MVLTSLEASQSQRKASNAGTGLMVCWKGRYIWCSKEGCYIPLITTQTSGMMEQAGPGQNSRFGPRRGQSKEEYARDLQQQMQASGQGRRVGSARISRHSIITQLCSHLILPINLCRESDEPSRHQHTKLDNLSVTLGQDLPRGNGWAIHLLSSFVHVFTEL